jgi:DNA-binding NarL/FixJ family response regulator
MIDVIFVDDDIGFAEAWSERVTRTMQLRSYATSSPNEALRLIRDPGVKIAVLDELLTGTGTDGVALGVAIKQIDPNVRWILLSGEATGAQITAAYDSGLQNHIHKNDALENLPAAIRQGLIQYGTGLTKTVESLGSPLYVNRTELLRRQEIRYYLMSVDSVERDYVPEDEWVSHTQINSGEEIEEVLEIAWAHSDMLESASEIRSGAQPNVPGFSASLRTEIASRENLTTVVSNHRAYKLVRRIKLPEEPRDPRRLHVKARLFQVAPVYVRVGVTVIARCSCCGHDEPVRGFLYFPRRRYSTRQEDFHSNGTTSITPTGMKDVPEPTRPTSITGGQ